MISISSRIIQVTDLQIIHIYNRGLYILFENGYSNRTDIEINRI